MTLTPFRIFEIVLYALINFLPYFVLALYPFKDEFRFSLRINIGLFSILLTAEIFIHIYASWSTSNNGPLTLLNTIIYASFFFFSIKAHPGKLVFILLVVSNMANQISFSAKFLENLIFPSLALEKNRWTFSVSLILVQLVFLPVFFLFIKKAFKEIMYVKLQNKIWNYLWLIPMTFYLFWFYITYFNSVSGTEVAIHPVYFTFALLINCGSLLIYYVISQTIHEFDKNYSLQIQNDFLAIQNLQYENLKKRMDETRQMRHDLRHHMTVLFSLCEAGSYEQLFDYLKEYLKNAPPSEQSLTYCSHFALNALLVYYAQIALERNIDFSIDISLPQDLPIADTDLCILFGNLLENACDGCSLLPQEKRFIALKALMPNPSSLVFTIDNTFLEQTVQKDVHGYVSSKHSGYGAGLNSVFYITDRYNGVLKIDTANGLFCVSVVLNF